MLWFGLIFVPPVIIHNVWFWICQVFASVFLQLFPMLWIHTPGVVWICLDRYFSRLFHLHFFSIVAKPNDIEPRCSIVEVWAYPWLNLVCYSISLCLISKPSFHTLSNAFCRSIHTACTAFCSWMQSSISCEKRVTLSYAVIAPKSCLFGQQLLFCFKMVIKPLVNNSFKTFGDATSQTDCLVPSCLYPFCRLGS